MFLGIQRVAYSDVERPLSRRRSPNLVSRILQSHVSEHRVFVHVLVRSTEGLGSGALRRGIRIGPETFRHKCATVSRSTATPIMGVIAADLSAYLFHLDPSSQAYVDDLVPPKTLPSRHHPTTGCGMHIRD